VAGERTLREQAAGGGIVSILEMIKQDIQKEMVLGMAQVMALGLEMGQGWGQHL